MTGASVIAMIFEYWFDPTDDTAYQEYQEYQEESSRLRELLPGVEGFCGSSGGAPN